MSIEKQKVFVPVSADKRLPNEAAWYFVIDKDGIKSFAVYDIERKRFLSSQGYYIAVSHWLEEKENVYVLTEDDAMFLDGILAHVEDYWHGEEGKKITEMRVSLQSVYKTNPQTENK